MVGIDHTPTTAFATEAYTLSPISAPVSESGSIPVPKQLDSVPSGQGLETPSTVSDHAVLTMLLITSHLADVFAHP